MPNGYELHSSTYSLTRIKEGKQKRWLLSMKNEEGGAKQGYASSMAHCAYQTFPPSPLRSFNNNKASSFLIASSKRPNTVLLSAISHNNRDSYNTFVSEAVGLLGPAMFDASKLKVEFMGEDMNNYVGIIPRTYILSHCDFTANLTLTISNVINLEQLKGWYSKDDVVAEWKRVNGEMCLHIHCYVSGPNLLLDLAAEFRYHIFSKEMPLVLKAVLHGDAPLFRENPELLNALVRVYFHSGLKKYNRIECWGPLKDAIEDKPRDQSQGVTASIDPPHLPDKWARPKSLFQVLFAFLL